MDSDPFAAQSRREFLKTAATVTTGVATANLLSGTLAAKDATRGIAIVLNSEDAKQRPAQWATAELRDAFKRRGLGAEIFENLEQAPAGFDCVMAATASSSSTTLRLGARSPDRADM